MSSSVGHLPSRAIWGYEYKNGVWHPIRTDASGYIQGKFYVVSGVGQSLTDPPPASFVSGIYYTYDSSGYLLTAVYKQNGNTLFTLSYSYVSGNLVSVVRS